MKPKLDIVEKDSDHILYHLYCEFDSNNMYERAKLINRFLTSECKVMERVLETDLRNFLREQGIIPQTMSESALKQAFDTLKGKGKDIEVIDRYKNVREKIVGVSNNQMTIIEDDQTISLSMEVRVVEYEQVRQMDYAKNETYR